MRLEVRQYTTDLTGNETAGLVAPEGYTLHGAAFSRHYPNTCHNDKPIMILAKGGKYYAQCACGQHLTTNGKDSGNDALTEFNNTVG